MTIKKTSSGEGQEKSFKHGPARKNRYRGRVTCLQGADRNFEVLLKKKKKQGFQGTIAGSLHSWQSRSSWSGPGQVDLYLMAGSGKFWEGHQH